jgi:hypothetical protein
MTDHINDPAQAAAEPVAWRVKNDFGHWYVTQHKDLADTWRDFEGYEVQDLYAAQPPAAPVDPLYETPEQWANRWRAAKAATRYSAVTAEDVIAQMKLDNEQEPFPEFKHIIRLVELAADHVLRQRSVTEPQTLSNPEGGK